MNFIRPNIMRLLRPVKGVELKAIETNTFVLNFEHPLDRKKAMKGCPWVLDKYALILEPIDPSKKHADHLLTSLPIMVRVLQLSLANRSEHVARLIGNSLGTFVEVPKSQDGFYTPFFRFQVLVDVTKPLKRGVNFQGVDRNRQWLQVAYERLPFFCFLCGILGHGEEDCPIRYEDGFTEPEKGLPYGSWMRVNDETRRPTGTTGGSSKPSPFSSSGAKGSKLMKRGSDIFTGKARGGNAANENENWQPNLTRGGGRTLTESWRRVEGENSMESCSNSSTGGRKRISISSHKRKAKEVGLGENRTIGKKPLL